MIISSTPTFSLSINDLIWSWSVAPERAKAITQHVVHSVYVAFLNGHDVVRFLDTQIVFLLVSDHAEKARIGIGDVAADRARAIFSWHCEWRRQSQGILGRLVEDKRQTLRGFLANSGRCFSSSIVVRREGQNQACSCVA